MKFCEEPWFVEIFREDSQIDFFPRNLDVSLRLPPRYRETSLPKIPGWVHRPNRDMVFDLPTRQPGPLGWAYF